MKPQYTSDFDLLKRRNSFRTFANGILWAVAFIIFLAVIGGGAFGATAEPTAETPAWLIISALLGVVVIIAYLSGFLGAAYTYFRNHWTNHPFDDTRDWIVASERKPRPAEPMQHAPAADLTLASASAAHDAGWTGPAFDKAAAEVAAAHPQCKGLKAPCKADCPCAFDAQHLMETLHQIPKDGYAKGGPVPKDFFVKPLGKPFNPDDYLNKGAFFNGRDEKGVCSYCDAEASQTHQPGCFYKEENTLIERPPRHPRPCRAADTPEAHDLLSNHVNEIDETLADPDHFDDLCIDAFADAIKAEMRVAREQKGRGGWWDDEAFSDEQLKLSLRLVMRKGDVVSIGAYAMMLHHRGITHIE